MDDVLGVGGLVKSVASIADVIVIGSLVLFFWVVVLVPVFRWLFVSLRGQTEAYSHND